MFDSFFPRKRRSKISHWAVSDRLQSVLRLKLNVGSEVSQQKLKLEQCVLRMVSWSRIQTADSDCCLPAADLSCYVGHHVGILVVISLIRTSGCIKSSD